MWNLHRRLQLVLLEESGSYFIEFISKVSKKNGISAEKRGQEAPEAMPASRRAGVTLSPFSYQFSSSHSSL